MESEKKQSKVTLMTPCYNGSKYLEQWKNCIVAQNYSNVEVIFINDGSTDDSEQVVLNYREEIEYKGYQFVYLKKDNGGAASAINHALKYATGDYLMLYDVDDIIMRNAIKLKAEFLDNHLDYGMVRNNGYYVRRKNLGQNSYLFVTKNSEKQNEYIFEDIVFARTNNWTGSYMIRFTNLWESLCCKEIYISPWGQNMQLMMPVSYFFKTGFIDIPLMRYVEHGSSVSRSQNFQRQLELFDGYKENRVEIIRRMSIPEDKKETYYNQLDIMYLHTKLECASQHTQKDMMNQFYQELASTHSLTIKDRLNYFFGKTKWTSAAYQRFKFVCKMTMCVYHKIGGKLLRHDKLY